MLAGKVGFAVFVRSVTLPLIMKSVRFEIESNGCAIRLGLPPQTNFSGGLKRFH